MDKKLNDKAKDGDILILDFKYKLTLFTEKTNTAEDKRLFINGETAQRMADHKIKCVGFGDGISVENRNEDITFPEVLENLKELQSETFFISFAPLHIKGLGSCPVRVYAIEGLAEFMLLLSKAVSVELYYCH